VAVGKHSFADTQPERIPRHRGRWTFDVGNPRRETTTANPKRSSIFDAVLFGYARR